MVEAEKLVCLPWTTQGLTALGIGPDRPLSTGDTTPPNSVSLGLALRRLGDRTRLLNLLVVRLRQQVRPPGRLSGSWTGERSWEGSLRPPSRPGHLCACFPARRQ